MPVINFAVEIITERTEFTNTAYGLKDGIFRYITGRPGYDGNDNPYPTWEDGSDNTEIWYEGWLLKDRMTNPIRSIDITETGSYGNMSSFNFSLRNDLLLWVYVRDNAIYFTNRDVKLYCVIDGVFYQIWQGVISNNPYDEVDYQFICNDAFNKIHKLIPPKVIDTTSVPGSDSSVQGETIPVSIGDILFSKLQRVTYEPIQTTLSVGRTASDLPYNYPACAATRYLTDGLSYPSIRLYTKGCTFAEDQLAGRYLYVNKGGGNPDTDQLIKIRGNDATNAETTDVELEAPFDFVTQDLFNNKYSYDPAKGDGGYTYWSYHYSSAYQVTYDPYSKLLVLSWMNSPTPYVRWTGVNFYNNGNGSNRIYARVYFERSGRLNVHVGTQLDPIIGSGVLIDKNSAPGWQIVEIDIEKQFGNNELVTFSFTGKPGMTGLISDWWVSHSPSDINTWWFSILQMPSTHIASNRDIKEYVTDENGNIPVYTYNDKTKLMEIAPNIVLSKTTTGASAELGHPEFVMYTSRMQKDGSVKYMTPVRARSWEIDIPDNGYMTIGGNNIRTLTSRTAPALYGFDLCNRDQTNTVSCYYPEHTAANIYEVTVKLEFPKDYIDQDWEKIYVAIDAHIQASALDDYVRVMGYVHMLDVYGDEVDLLMSDDSDLDPTFYYPIDEVPVQRVFDYNSLPPEYYRDGGTTDGTTPNLWGLIAENGDGEDTPYKTLLELPDEIVNAIKDGTTTNMVAVKFYVTSIGGSSEKFSLKLTLKEAGFVCYKTVNVQNDDFYARLKGEMLSDGSETNTVYTAMRLMLEEYDGIPAANIDYTNLPKMRHTGWNVGRQLTDQKRSSDYITELARHSFVGVYPTRDGLRGLRAWRDPYGSEVAYDYPIIVDSITSYKNTEVAQLYNDLYVEFNYNPVNNKPGNIIRVTNVDQAAFPDETTIGSYVEAWKEWVSGISGNTYNDAKQLWEVCHESYLRANIVQPLSQSTSLCKLYWFSNITDDNLYKAVLTPQPASTGGSAYKYLKNCTEWLTRQKAEVKFSTQLDSDSVKTELLHAVSFTDPVYTHNETRTGWVTEVEFDINNNTLKLGYILQPEDEIIDNLIIERGQLLNDDTHVESGSQDDQVQDTQDRI